MPTPPAPRAQRALAECSCRAKWNEENRGCVIIACLVRRPAAPSRVLPATSTAARISERRRPFEEPLARGGPQTQSWGRGRRRSTAPALPYQNKKQSPRPRRGGGRGGETASSINGGAPAPRWPARSRASNSVAFVFIDWEEDELADANSRTRRLTALRRAFPDTVRDHRVRQPSRRTLGELEKHSAMPRRSSCSMGTHVLWAANPAASIPRSSGASFWACRRPRTGTADDSRYGLVEGAPSRQHWDLSR